MILVSINIVSIGVNTYAGLQFIDNTFLLCYHNISVNNLCAITIKKYIKDAGKASLGTFSFHNVRHFHMLMKDCMTHEDSRAVFIYGQIIAVYFRIGYCNTFQV